MAKATRRDASSWHDHRLVDGEHAVTFLVRVNERLEEPGRMLFEV